MLSTPWYGDNIVNLADPVVLEHRIKTSPTHFARRNVFCGNRLYQNKARFKCEEESHNVTLSEAKGLSRSAARCFAALSMTGLTFLLSRNCQVHLNLA